jgi:hypothetical protein
MLQLNSRVQGASSTIARSFEYELPAFLAKGGEKCFLKVEVKPLSECSALMVPAIEPIANEVKARTTAMNKRLDKATKGCDDPDDMTDPLVESAYRNLASSDTSVQQKFNRATLLACFENCVLSWSSNIESEGKEIDATAETFAELVHLAYPDSGLPTVGELTLVFSRMRDDILQGQPGEAEAMHEEQDATVKN